MPIYERFTPRTRNGIFICLVLTCLVAAMLNTVLNTVLPAMMSDFCIDSATAQWLSSGYSLAMAIAMPLTAYLSGRIPTKPLYLGALTVFSCGIALSALAPDFELMMVGRVVQACGNGVIGALTQVVLLSIFPPERRGTIMGWYGLSVGLSPIVAPTLGGLVADVFTWRYIFYFALAMMAFALVGAAVFFRNVLETSKQPFDAASFSLSALMFGGITLGIGNLSTLGISSLATLAPLAVGLVSTPFFIKRQLNSKAPFLELRTFTVRPFALAVAGSVVLYFVMMASSLLTPLYIQTIAGLSAAVSGLCILPGSALTAAVSPLAGKLYDALGIRALLATSGLAMAASNVGMMLLNGSPESAWGACALFALRSAAVSCALMPLVTWGVGSLSEKWTAHGTSLINALRTIGGALGMAVGVGFMNAVSQISGSALQGMHAAFAMLAACSLVLLVIGIASKNSRT